MKIAILGTRGIPNNYGGFEQVTEWLAPGLAGKGHEVTVYNSHNHPWQQDTWGEVNIVHCYDPEYILNTAGQFVYDLNCILDAGKRNFDVILFMGYTSSSIWKKWFPKDSVIISNMDGLEWKRSKYSKPVQQFLKYAEKMAIRYSHFHIADSIGIQKYILRKYGVYCKYIPYAAACNLTEKKEIFDYLGLGKQNYYMLMARMEPENNIDLILQGFSQSNSEKKFIVVGSFDNRYGKQLRKKYRSDIRIQFAGPLYDQDLIHTLRSNCVLYFHGHSVGGTNPSLLEAMASESLIAAHHNTFNKTILGEDAFYFSSAEDVERLTRETMPASLLQKIKKNNITKVKELYHPQTIIGQYDEYIAACYEKMKNEKFTYQRRYAYK